MSDAAGRADRGTGATDWELTTVADDEAVPPRRPRGAALDGLDPDTRYELDGLAFRTLPRPAGERLATFATVNDVHFGEIECGRHRGHRHRARSCAPSRASRPTRR